MGNVAETVRGDVIDASSALVIPLICHCTMFFVTSDAHHLRMKVTQVAFISRHFAETSPIDGQMC